MKILTTIFYFFQMFLCLVAHPNGFKSELSEDGKTIVEYKIYDTLNVNGEEITIIEYKVKMKTYASLENCISIFSSPNMHKIFYEYTEVSKKVKQVSEDEWIMYYYYSPPWPIADSDCVSRIIKTTDTLEKKVTFTSFADPEFIKIKDVARSEFNDITFIFSEISKNEIEIFIQAKVIPVVAAPNWMIKRWFPDGPVALLNRFKKLAEAL